MGNDDWDSRDIKYIKVTKEMPVPWDKKDYIKFFIIIISIGLILLFKFLAGFD